MVVASAWAVIVAALATAARLLSAEGDEPSWGEVVATTLYNSASLFVVAFAAALVLRSVHRRRAGVNEPGAVANASRVPQTERAIAWTVRGHPVAPTTTEGRLALVAALLAVVPFLGGLAMFAAPLLLVLAVRRGDRGLLLILPLLVGLFLIVFIVAEFTIGHD